MPDWRSVGEWRDIRYELAEGIAKVTIDRPEVRNAFRPRTVVELSKAFSLAQDDPEVGVIILTGEGPHAFCSGGDQKVRGAEGYVDDEEMGRSGPGRFDVTALHLQIRRCPKPVVAMVAGYAVGGGHVLHIVCDLTIAADNARFGQTGPKVGSFDGGYGAGLLANQIGAKKAREIWFLCRQYDAQQALEMGLVNTVVPLDRLEEETVGWCREMLALSPMALRLLKASFNASEDGLAGIQQLAHDANLLFYMSEEGQEGRNAYVEKRPPDFSKFPTTAMNRWVLGARPRTLPATVVPVLVGTAVAAGGGIHWWRALVAMVVAVAIQVATNYANDYADGVRGTDDVRVGPVRLVASRLATPAEVKRAALLAGAVAAVAGLTLVPAVGPEVVVIGAASLAAGYLYTGGPRPYGYAGLGEVFVFLFFGVVATTGSSYVQLEEVTLLALAASVPVGFLATALLVVNNLRDIRTDGAVGKRTLAVRLGEPATRALYGGLVVGAFLVVPVLALRRPLALLALLAVPLVARPLRLVSSQAAGRALLPALADTGRLSLGFGVLLAAGLALSA